MEKLSADKVLAVFGSVPSTLRKLASERDAAQVENLELKRQLRELRLNERVEKIAQEVHDKGIQQGRTVEETREFLLQKAAAGKLDIIEQAVDMTSRQASLGILGDLPKGGESSLDEFVVS